MSVLAKPNRRRLLDLATPFLGLMMMVLGFLLSREAQALPLFARQTGQNCVACHAGGQFPELTPYGRMFKLTGYTIGKRVDVPLSVMGQITYSKVRDTSKSDDPAADFQKNASPIFSGGSVLFGGKVTDNIGAFIQWTYDNYAGQTSDGRFQGKPSADNIDIRYADRFVDAGHDLIFGLSVNNNPSVSDPWNTAAAWEQYVPVPSPTGSRFIDGSTPYSGFGSGSNLAGMTLYMYLNKIFYAELGTYQTANRGFSFMSGGINDANTTKLKGGNNPYWRLALTHEWGPHNIMVGTSGMVAHVYDSNTDTSDPNSVHRFNNTGVDAQYQYLLDPHTITGQFVYMRQKQTYSAVAANVAPTFADANNNSYSFVDAAGFPLPVTNSTDTINIFRAKLSYVYRAKVGGSLSYFNLSGTTNTANQTSGYDPCSVPPAVTSSADPASGCAPSVRVAGNLSGNPATRGFTYEAFFMPVQYVRVGAQYTAYNKFNGASDNYDGFGRNARDNNSLFLYIWGAY